MHLRQPRIKTLAGKVAFEVLIVLYCSMFIIVFMSNPHITT